MTIILSLLLAGAAFCAGSTCEMAISLKQERSRLDWRLAAALSAWAVIMSIVVIVLIATEGTP